MTEKARWKKRNSSQGGHYKSIMFKSA